MRALLLMALVAVALPSRADAEDCLGVTFGKPAAQPTVRGKIVAVKWGKPITVPCKDGATRCFESALAMRGEPSNVQVVLERVDYRDAQGGGYKMKRVVLDGVLLKDPGCKIPSLAVGQTRELVIETKPGKTWRVVGMTR